MEDPQQQELEPRPEQPRPALLGALKAPHRDVRGAVHLRVEVSRGEEQSLQPESARRGAERVHASLVRTHLGDDPTLGAGVVVVVVIVVVVVAVVVVAAVVPLVIAVPSLSCRAPFMRTAGVQC